MPYLLNEGLNQKNLENRPFLELNFTPINTPIIPLRPYGSPLKGLMGVKNGQKWVKNCPNQKSSEYTPLLELNFTPKNTPNDQNHKNSVFQFKFLIFFNVD